MIDPSVDPGRSPLDPAAYLTAWARTHGVEPRGLVRFWLLQMHWLARPFVRARVSPSLVSLLGVLIMVGAAGLAAADFPGHLVLAAIAAGVGGIADGLDGAVAVLQRRVTARGGVVDAVCDRFGDGLLMVALWLAGAPGMVCLLAGLVFGLHEYVRAALRAAVPPSTRTVVTVAERPTRVIVVVAFLLADGTASGWSDDLVDVAHVWLVAGAWASLVLGVFGLVQLIRWAGRTLA